MKSIKYIPEQVELSSTPSTPDVGHVKIYRKTDKLWYELDSSGVERPFPVGGFTETLTSMAPFSSFTGDGPFTVTSNDVNNSVWVFSAQTVPLTFNMPALAIVDAAFPGGLVAGKGNKMIAFVNTGSQDITFNDAVDFVNGSGTRVLRAGRSAFILIGNLGSGAGYFYFESAEGIASGGGASPTTTHGDLIVRGASADIRLPVVTERRVLTSDSTVTGKVKWYGRPVDIFSTNTMAIYPLDGFSTTVPQNAGYVFISDSSGNFTHASDVNQTLVGNAILGAKPSTMPTTNSTFLGNSILNLKNSGTVSSVTILGSQILNAVTTSNLSQGVYIGSSIGLSYTTQNQINNVIVGYGNITSATGALSGSVVLGSNCATTATGLSNAIIIGNSTGTNHGSATGTILIGDQSGGAKIINGANNIGIGLQVFGSTGTLSGTANIAIGSASGANANLSALTTGLQNTAIGTQVLNSATGSHYNVGIGSEVLTLITNGHSGNISIGYHTGRNILAITTPSVFIGSEAAKNTALHSGNVNGAIYIGNQSGRQNPSNGCIAIGDGAMSQTAYLSFANIAIGNGAAQRLIAGSDSNIAIGNSAFSGTYAIALRNTVLGDSAASAGAFYNDAVVIGRFAGQNKALSTTVAIGNNTLSFGVNNIADCVAVGHDALRSCQTQANTALGANALRALTTGNQSVAVGNACMQLCTTGTQNTALGNASLTSLTTGSSNVALGWRSGSFQTTGSFNVLAGYAAGQNITTGSNNIFIGDVGVSLNTAAAPVTTALSTKRCVIGSNTNGINEFVLGADPSVMSVVDTQIILIAAARGNGPAQNNLGPDFLIGAGDGTGTSSGGQLKLYTSNQTGAAAGVPNRGWRNGIRITNAGTMAMGLNAEALAIGTNLIAHSSGARLDATGAWLNASDKNLKENIEGISYGLKAVLSLTPRKYTHKESGVNTVGLIAQELEQVIPELVNNEGDFKGVNYAQLTAVLVKAIQELKAEIDSLTLTKNGAISKKQ